jgi:hypothetical protein
MPWNNDSWRDYYEISKILVSVNEVADWNKDRAYQGGKVFFIGIACFLLFSVIFYLVLERWR